MNAKEFFKGVCSSTSVGGSGGDPDLGPKSPLDQGSDVATSAVNFTRKYRYFRERKKSTEDGFCCRLLVS